jgi:hypothetical protein
MAKPTRKNWPNLAKCWDDYGHAIKFEDLFDVKVGEHGYVALAWKTEDGMVDYADLSSADKGETCEMNNDGHEPVTLRAWRKATIPADCDWLDFDEEDEDE